MKQCTKCVIPETSETIGFDEKGVCTVCNQVEYKNEIINWKERNSSLEEILKEHKGKYAYDCIVPFSGGKDSVFALWHLVEVRKLKPLVVRFDHGFLRNTVQLNTNKALNKLGVDFINFKPNVKIVKKLMIESLFRRGDFCWHCHVGIAAFPIRTAIEKKVPLIFYGEPSAEYASFYSYKDIEELDVVKFNRAINLGINAEDILGMVNERFPKDKIEKRDLDPFFFPSKLEINKNNIKALYLGNYVKWDVRKQVEIIQKELDWQGDEVEGVPDEYHYEKIECYMQGLRDYIRYFKRGFGRTAHLTSIDIRNDRLSRKKALELTKENDGKIPKALDLFLKMTDMSKSEFYDVVLKHVVEPNKPISKEEFLRKNLNKFPKDFENFEKNF